MSSPFPTPAPADTRQPNVMSVDRSVLIVDDHPGVRELLARTLAASGWRVFLAADGRHAGRILDVQKIDLLLTDLVMPEGEGIELIIAARARHRKLAILAISGEGVTGPGEFLSAARLVGAQRTLAKPFTPDDLLATIAEMFPVAVA